MSKLNLQNSLEKKTSKQIYDFFNNFTGYKSEVRNVVKMGCPDGLIRYHIEFTYTFITEDKLFKPAEQAIITVFDEVPFATQKEAEYYAKIARYPSTKNTYVYESFYNRYYLHTIYDDKLKKLNSTYDFESAFSREKGKRVFGIYGTNDFDKDSLDECLSCLSNTYRQYFYIGEKKIVKTFDIHDMLNITSSEEEDLVDDLEQCKSERNILLIKEIERSRKYIKFLKSLLK